ncbi:MAG: hypothetical protein JSR12_11410 [Bacteroidetes bacterium]|nr:hypothetical protein [Bacteroidota bacterium]
MDTLRKEGGKELRRKLIFYFILISFLSVIWYSYEDSSFFLETPRKIRHLLKGILVCTISILGYIPFKYFRVLWPIKIWTIVHILLIGVIVLIGVLDWLLAGISFNIRNMADGIFYFIISPIPFLVLTFLFYKFKKNPESL